MVMLIEVDKSGMDFFDRDYSIAVVRDKKEVYGYKVTQEFTDKLLSLFNNNELGIDSSQFSKNKQRVKLKVRAHAACIILVIKEILRECGGFDDVIIHICNDIDGHFEDIRNMVYSHMKYDVPNLNLKEHITPARFPKSSLVNIAARNIRENHKDSSIYNLPKLSVDELIKIIKKVR